MFTSSRRLLAAVIFCATFIRFFAAWKLELFPDETLYAWQSSTMPSSFCPHPPIVLMMCKAGITLWGHNEFGVRFFSVLFSTLMLWPLWIVAREIGDSVQNSNGENSNSGNSGGASSGGESVAFWTVLAAVAAPLYFTFGAITTPDGVQLLFWATALLSAWRALNTAQLKWWLATGVVLGIGLFAKYVLILFLPALLCCLLLAPQWRPQLKTAAPWLCIFFALIIFLPPFLRHEYLNDWITTHYHLSSRQTRQFPNGRDIGVYQLYHIAYYSPLLYALALVATIWALREGWKTRASGLVFVASFAVVPYIFFALIASVTARGLSREQWDAPAYLAAFIAFALWAQHADKGETLSEMFNKRARWQTAAVATGFAMSFLVLGESAFMMLSAPLGQIPFINGVYGAKPLSQAIDVRQSNAQFIKANNEKPDQNAVFPTGFRADILVGDNFASTLSYAFYGSRLPFYTAGEKFNQKYGLVNVLNRIEIMSNASPSFAQLHQGQNILYIEGKDDRKYKQKQQVRRILDSLRPHFRTVHFGRPIEIRRGRQYVRSFLSVECEGLTSTPEVWVSHPTIFSR